MIGELFSGDVFLWTCLWQSTACVAAGLLLSFALIRRPARAHQVLLLAMVAAVAVPAMSALVRHFDLGLFSAEPAAVEPEKESILPISTYIVPEISAPTATEYVLEPVEPSPPIVAAAAEKTEIPWASLAAYAWITASLLLTARLALTFVSGIRLLRRATPLDSISIREAARIAKAKLGVTKDMSVRGSESISSPVIWCWAKKPVFLVPSDKQRGDEIDWVSVLCHELAHYKRRDHISGLLAELVVCILPWNALLWWAKARLVRLSEEACDDWVVATGQPGPDYAKLLLDLLPQGRMAFVPTVVGSKRELQARVRRLVHGRCGNPRAGSRWAWLATILAACVALGTALAQERRPDPPTSRGTDATSARSYEDKELAEREQLERETRLLQEQEERERAQRERQVMRAELTRHRQELLEQIGRFERELAGLRDDQDEQARELQARLREIRGELRRVEAELGGLEREPRDIPPREAREAELRNKALLAEREALQKRLHELEQALDRLPDGRVAEAREIQAELQGIREQMRNIEQQLRDVEEYQRQRREPERPEADARMRELTEHREQLQKKARDMERKLREQPDSPEAEELRVVLREMHEQIQRINQELAEIERAPRERPEPERPEVGPRVRQLVEHRQQLEEKARDIERKLKEQPDSPEAKELQAGLREIHEQIQRINQELAEMERAPRERERQRPEQARVEELRQAIAWALEQGRGDEAGRLERELRQITERPVTRPESRPEAPGLEQQVRQLRNEVQGLRQEMAELRELLKQLLQRQREAERREREPRPEGEQIGVEGPRF